MLCRSNRREFLGLLAGAAALSSKAFGQTRLMAVKLADNFVEITGAGGNVLVAMGPDGVAMVNGGLAENSAELLKLVAGESGGRPVRVLFNTDWHPENTGSNEPLKRAGAKILSHQNTKLWLGAEIDVTWQNRTYEPRPEALPNETFYTSGKMTFGKEQIEYALMPQAHTDGDIYVFFPGPNILMAGDVVSVGKYPTLDFSTGGWIGGLVEAQKTLLKISSADTRIIPGTGPIQTRADLQAQLDMFTAIKDRLVKLMKQGMGPKEMVAAAPTKDFDEKWGNSEQFILNAYRGLWGHVRELGGIV